MNALVKICGVTRALDAVTAVRLGAGAIGLNFVPASPRRIDARPPVLPPVEE